MHFPKRRVCGKQGAGCTFRNCTLTPVFRLIQTLELEGAQWLTYILYDKVPVSLQPILVGSCHCLQSHARSPAAILFGRKARHVLVIPCQLTLLLTFATSSCTSRTAKRLQSSPKMVIGCWTVYPQQSSPMLRRNSECKNPNSNRGQVALF